MSFTTTADATTSVEGAGAYEASVRTFANQTICVVYEYETRCISGSKINADTGEGLAGWEITLSNSTGVVDSTMTGADGSYEFCDLVPGAYTVAETPQAGWQAVGPTSIDVMLECDDSENNNFVNTPLLCINGTKINDCNDEGLAGWEICLTKPDGSTVCTMTDVNGDYSFCGLAPGVYEVCETVKAGWEPVGDTCVTVTLVDVDEVADFTNAPLLCINGTKINDCNGEGLEGWTIKLYSESGLEMATATTDANGDYSFCGLAPGSYRVCEVVKAGWEPVGDTCIPVYLECEDSTGNDFTNAPLLCINGYKFNYEDNTGLPGWEICLTKPDGTTVCTMTDSTGKYQFCNLTPGTYTVCETPQMGWTPVGDACITVDLECEDSTDNDFYNAPEVQKACETAWANWGESGTCLIDSGCAKNWGWFTEVSLEDLEAGVTSDVWAAAGQCDLDKGYNVGTVTVTLDNETNTLSLDFALNSDCEVEEWHVWASDKTLCPHRGFSKWFKGEGESGEIKLKAPLTDPAGDGVFIAVHSVVCCGMCHDCNLCTYCDGDDD